MVGPNDRRLRGKPVRLITENNENAGVVSFDDALARAGTVGQDLVEVAGDSAPPVCRIMDYGKFMYEERKKRRESRKKHHVAKLKEIQFHQNIDDHDYTTKLNRGIAFLDKGFKVKVSVYFRGREMAHRDRGRDLLERVIRDTAELAHVDTPPRMAGRNLMMFLAPGARH